MRRYVFAALLVGSLGLTACSSGNDGTRDEAGAGASEGTVNAASVKLGDCLNEPITITGKEFNPLEDVVAVPCAQPHDVEVFATFDLPKGEYPGEEAVGAAAEERCRTEFEGFVGVAFDESVFASFTYQPTQSAWEQRDDRRIVCLAGDPEGRSTGTLEGAAR